MKELPPQLKLTSKQRKDVQGAYYTLAKQERTLLDAPIAMFEKRVKARKASDDCNARLDQILSRKQRIILRAWEASKRRQGMRRQLNQQRPSTHLP
jgi:hypothetical protein